jgi:alkyl hydroperoxide reductase 1
MSDNLLINFSKGAFTPTCSARHLPSYIEKRADLASKGVDIIAVTASNDAWVLNAWAKVNGIQGDDIVRSYLIVSTQFETD